LQSLTSTGTPRGNRSRHSSRVAKTDCLFCAIVAGTAPAHIVIDEPDVVAFLDIRPVFKGHVLVVPRQHFVTLPELPTPLLTSVFVAVQRCGSAVVDGLGAQGSWVAENNIVSQAVPHVHVHVVPRTKGDGLRGFFWPRQKYADDDEMIDYADRLRAALQMV
jgi:histidine triad (HIT) family protein